MPKLGRVRIGISGWTYAPWRGTFYPPKLPHHRELAYAAGILSSIEINGTFYSLQRPESYAKWAANTPEDFAFSVKAPRFITHLRRLKDARAPLANFLASGLLRLGQKLGPILWQLPPNFKFDHKRIETFLKLLPHDTESAAALARRHDKRISGRAWMKTDAQRPLRHAMEIRHASFAVPEFIQLLRIYDVALVCADTVEWPRLMDVTSDFIYCRLHGSEELYVSGYDAKSLDSWAVRVDAWARGGEPDDAERVITNRAPKKAPRDVFIYFDNDAKVRAPFDAQSLIKRGEKLWGLHGRRQQFPKARLS
ncbi:MAG: DUF72 domain-containing protein [Candidatus Acidiferrales bacterium]